jgi:hypothetical protein
MNKGSAMTGVSPTRLGVKNLKQEAN